MLFNLKHKDHRKVKLTLELVEICSKNGNLSFHRILAGKDFSEQFLVLLKRVRKIIPDYYHDFVETRQGGVVCEETRV